jgi:hypothetical protein
LKGLRETWESVDLDLFWAADGPKDDRVCPLANSLPMAVSERVAAAEKTDSP